MKLEEAINKLKETQDSYLKDELDEAIETALQEIEHLQKKYDKDTHILQNQLDLANARIFELQKENEELISEKTKLLLTDLSEANKLYDEENKRCMMFAIENNDLKEKLDNSISKDKMKELILNKKQKVQENNAEIEKCRKTIMEEQELKKLKLYTLHRKNDLLELEIADLFDLLKEE